MKIRQFILLISLSLIFSSTASAQITKEAPWAASTSSNQVKSLSSVGKGEGPNGIFLGQIAINCSPGKDGTFFITTSVDDPKQVKSFPFDEYEGPDAPALGKKLAVVQLIGGDKNVSFEFKTAMTGYYNVKNGFSFEFSRPNHGNNELTKLLKRLEGAAENTSLSIHIPTFKNPKISLDFVFSVDGLRSFLQNFMQECQGKTAK